MRGPWVSLKSSCLGNQRFFIGTRHKGQEFRKDVSRNLNRRPPNKRHPRGIHLQSSFNAAAPTPRLSSHQRLRLPLTTVFTSPFLFRSATQPAACSAPSQPCSCSAPLSGASNPSGHSPRPSSPLPPSTPTPPSNGRSSPSTAETTSAPPTSKNSTASPASAAKAAPSGSAPRPSS